MSQRTNRFKAKGLGDFVGVAGRSCLTVDLVVDPGETVLRLRANSAGKPALLRTIIGLLPTWRGEIRFDGEVIGGLPPDQRIRRGIAHMSELGVFPGLTIAENMRLGGYFLSEAEVRRRSRRLYEVFPDLAEKRRALAASLSGGQHKMLGIAKVLVAEPKLSLMGQHSLRRRPPRCRRPVRSPRRRRRPRHHRSRSYPPHRPAWPGTVLSHRPRTRRAGRAYLVSAMISP